MYIADENTNGGRIMILPLELCHCSCCSCLVEISAHHLDDEPPKAAARRGNRVDPNLEEADSMYCPVKYCLFDTCYHSAHHMPSTTL